MIRIKLLTLLTVDQTASVLAYTSATNINGDITANLSDVDTIKKINPNSTFSVISTEPVTCIIHTALTKEELEIKVGSDVTILGIELFKAENISATTVESLLNDPDIINIQENDMPIVLMAFPTATSIYMPGTTDVHVDLASIDSTISTSTSSDVWALPRIFNRVLPYETEIKRFTPINQVTTNVYLMDSGVNAAHSEFNNNVVDLFSMIPGNFADGVGHGTSLASAIVGQTCGVGPGYVTVKNVKIFDTSRGTTLEDLINAFQAIANDAIANPGIHVVNMSWVISKNTIVENVIQQLIDTLNIKFVCAAGNSGTPIELLTPASMKSILTVGAIDSSNTICGFTNYNTDAVDITLPLFTETSVDVFAPGFNCKAANYLDNTGFMSSTGTSIASAYVAGVAAYTALLNYPTVVSQKNLYDSIIGYSTKELITITDPKYALMPNRIVWQLHDCAETAIPNIQLTHSFALTPFSSDLTLPSGNNPIPDLTAVPPSYEEKIASYVYNINRKDLLTNNNSAVAAMISERYKISQALLLDITKDQVGDPINVVVVRQNYLNNINMIFNATTTPDVNLSLQYKTSGTTSTCAFTWLCSATGIFDYCTWDTYNICTKRFVGYYTQTVYAWTNSLSNGYIQTFSTCVNGVCGSGSVNGWGVPDTQYFDHQTCLYAGCTGP